MPKLLRPLGFATADSKASRAIGRWRARTRTAYRAYEARRTTWLYPLPIDYDQGMTAWEYWPRRWKIAMYVVAVLVWGAVGIAWATGAI